MTELAHIRVRDFTLNDQCFFHNAISWAIQNISSEDHPTDPSILKYDFG